MITIDFCCIIIGFFIILMVLIKNNKRHHQKLYNEEQVINILTDALNTSILRNNITSIPKWFKENKNNYVNF